MLGAEYHKFCHMWLLINGRGCCAYGQCVSFSVLIFLCEEDYSIKILKRYTLLHVYLTTAICFFILTFLFFVYFLVANQIVVS